MASSSKAGGVICSGGEVLYNSILAGNTGAQYLGCAFDHSNVVTGKGAPPGSGNKDVDCNLSTTYKPAAGSACVNAGNSSAPGLSKLDRDSGPRIKGSAADMGAYEVQ